MAATGTLISVEAYLRTPTDPDCEYVHGVLEERPVGGVRSFDPANDLGRLF